jgi:hypothetical protein
MLVVGVLIVTVGITLPLIVMVIALEVAVVGDAHAAVEVITQVTTCPLVSADVVKVVLLVPALVPFTCH